MDLYIYYQVRGENMPALQARATVMQHGLIARYGVAATLKRRPVEKDGLQTWMEVYHAVPDGFEAMLDDAVTQAGLVDLIEGCRHTEHFVDIPPCA